MTARATSEVHAVESNGAVAADAHRSGAARRRAGPGAARLGSRSAAGGRMASAATGRAVIRGEEVDRFELPLGEHAGARYAGYLRVGEALGAAAGRLAARCGRPAHSRGRRAWASSGATTWCSCGGKERAPWRGMKCA